MQGTSGGQRDLLDVESVAGHLLPAGSVFAFLAEHRLSLFPPQMCSDLFPSGRGRPSVPPDVVASVLVLQALHGLSDRQAAEAVTFDLRWKAAVGLPVTAGAFHPTTLTVWRRRLAASDRPDRIFEAVREVILQTGVVRGATRRALDSTVLDDAVARQDTVTQLIAAVRRVGRVVPGAGALLTRVCTGYDYTRAGKPDIAWDDEQARQELVSALVNDALALVEAIQVEGLDEGLDEAGQQAVALLALVAGQDVEPAEGSDGTDGRWRIARRTAEDRVISTVDPDARHAHKTRHRRHDGFKAHIIIEPATGLITGAEVTKASGTQNSDATVGARLLAADATMPAANPEQGVPDTVADQGQGVGIQSSGQSSEQSASCGMEVLGDSAYGTGDMLAALGEAGHAAVIKPWPLRPVVEGGFTLDDFAVDEAAGTVTCPNGLVRYLTAQRAAIFGTACANCPVRDRCTTSKTGRALRLHPHDALQRAHRARAADPDFQATYRQHRPMVERSIAWLVRGNRRVPYRGVTKNNAWIQRRVAGLNLRRMLALGLTRHEGAWAIS